MATRDDKQRVDPKPLACPTCGHVAEGVRCPRCNALKLTACSGACRSCRSRCG